MRTVQVSHESDFGKESLFITVGATYEAFLAGDGSPVAQRNVETKQPNGMK